MNPRATGTLNLTSAYSNRHTIATFAVSPRRELREISRDHTRELDAEIGKEPAHMTTPHDELHCRRANIWPNK